VACNLVTVHAGHADIEQHDLWLIGGNGFYRNSAIVCNSDFRAEQLQQQPEAIGCVSVVVYHQDARRTLNRGRGSECEFRRYCTGIGHQRQPHHELTAFAETLTVRVYAASVHLDERAHQSETNPKATPAAVFGGIALHEQVEHAG